MYTPSAIGPRVHYHGELVHRAEPKSHNLTNHALGTPRHFARRCINQPLHAVNLFYMSARVDQCWEAGPRVSLRLPAGFELRVAPQRPDRDVSSKSSLLDVPQSRSLRQICLRYQYWTVKISVTYGFIKCGEIRSTSAAKMTACGNSNAAVVNSWFCAEELSFGWSGRAKLTKFWTKENEAVRPSDHSLDHGKDLNM